MRAGPSRARIGLALRRRREPDAARGSLAPRLGRHRRGTPIGFDSGAARRAGRAPHWPAIRTSGVGATATPAASVGVLLPDTLRVAFIRIDFAHRSRRRRLAPVTAASISPGPTPPQPPIDRPPRNRAFYHAHLEALQPLLRRAVVRQRPGGGRRLAAHDDNGAYSRQRHGRLRTVALQPGHLRPGGRRHDADDVLRRRFAVDPRCGDPIPWDTTTASC